MSKTFKWKRAIWIAVSAILILVGGLCLLTVAALTPDKNWIDCQRLVDTRALAAPPEETQSSELTITKHSTIEFDSSVLQDFTVSGISFSPTSEHLVITGKNQFHVWNLSMPEDSYSLVNNEQTIQSHRWSPDGTQLAISISGYPPIIKEHSDMPWDWDNWIEIWDISSYTKQLTLMGIPGDMGGYAPVSVGPIFFSPDGTLIVAQSGNGFYVWDSKTGEECCYFDYPVLDEHTEERLLSIGWRYDEPPIISMQTVGRGISLNSTSFWDSGRSRVTTSIDTDEDRFVGTTWSPGSNYAALLSSSAAYGKSRDRITVWDSAEGNLLLSLEETTLWDWSPDGLKIIVSSAIDKSGFSVWDITTGEEIFRSEELPAPLYTLNWAIDGESITGFLEDGSIIIWTVESTP